MKKRSFIALIAAIGILLMSNIYAISLVNGEQISYDETHNGYFENTAIELYWGGDDDEGAVYSTTDLNGYLLITCYSKSFSASEDVYVAKFDPNMKQLWNTSWSISDNARPVGIVVDSSNSVYVAGTVQTTLPGPKYVQNVFLMKINISGELIWANVHETVNLEEQAASITIDSASDYVYVSGHTNSSNGDMFVQKYYKNGNYIDTFYYGDTIPEETMVIGGMTIDDNDDLFIAASTNKSLVGNFQDLVLVKMNSTSGLPYWNTTFGYTSPKDQGIDIEIEGSSAYLLGQIISPVPTDLDAVIVKFNATTGAYIWDSVLDFGNDTAANLDINRYGNPVFTGTTNAIDPDYDLYVAEFNQTGHLVWNATIGSTEAEIAGDIVCDGDFAYVVGISYNATEGSNNVLILVLENNYEYDFPASGPFGKIFGIILGTLIIALSIVFIVGIVYTYFKK